MEDQAQAVSQHKDISDCFVNLHELTMSCHCLVTKATIDPITAHVGYQGNLRDSGTKSWCLDSLKLVECQRNDSNFRKIRELCLR